jgi:hypothetical protein
MKQHYFVVSWDEVAGWEMDSAVADAVLDGTVYDTEKEQWTTCDTDAVVEQDERCQKQLIQLLEATNKQQQRKGK